MPEERPNERTARFIVHEVLGCPAERFEDGSAPSQVDAEIVGDAARAGLEIVGDLDKRFIEQWRALDRVQHRVEVPGLSKRWIVSLERGASVKTAVARVPDLMQSIESGQLRWATYDMPREFTRIGVDQIYPIENDDRPGGVVHFVTAGDGGMVPDVLVINPWLEAFFERHQDVPRKLAAHNTADGHAFIWVTNMSDLAVQFAAIGGVPQEEPVLPDGVTHLWLVGSSSYAARPLLWSPDRGWWRSSWSLPADGRLEIPASF